jgi:hypothetical protein
MKKTLASIIIFVFSILYVLSQNIGLRANAEFSDNKRINNSFGGGIYLNFDDFSKKIEILVSFDFIKNRKDFPDNNPPYNTGMFSAFHKNFFSASPLYVLPIKEKIKAKIGPQFSYNSVGLVDDFYPINMFNSYKSKYIGFGAVANIQFKKVFDFPINLDIFFSPTYLYNIKYESGPIGIKNEFADNLKIMNFQVGLSYNLK